MVANIEPNRINAILLYIPSANDFRSACPIASANVNCMGYIRELSLYHSMIIWE